MIVDGGVDCCLCWFVRLGLGWGVVFPLRLNFG